MESHFKFQAMTRNVFNLRKWEKSHNWTRARGADCGTSLAVRKLFNCLFLSLPTVFRLFSDDVFRLLKSSSSWSKLSMMGPQLFSGWYQMILDVFQCSQLFSDVFRLFSDDVFRLLKSSSNWTKSSMMGPQLFLGWYQMILDVFRCSD